MMNKILKKLATVLMCAVILFALPLSASARRPLVDFTQKGSVTFTMTHDGNPVSGGTWTLYRVADISYDDDANLIWTKTGDFSVYTHDFNTMDLTKSNDTLRSFIEMYNIQGTKKYVGNNGQIVFDNLDPALYYICQWDNAPGYYRAEAFFVNVPFFNGEDYIYDIIAEPKTQMSPDGQDYPTPPPSGPTPPPKIPDTGITQWPVPVFAMGGIILFAFGWYQFRKGERK